MKNILSILLIVLFVSTVGFAQDYTSGLLERNQIPEKYKWDTRDVYEDEEAWRKDYDWIEINISQSYLINNASSIEEKLYHMEQYLDNVVLYVYNTCMMAQFELLLYEKVENGEPLTSDALNSLYGELLIRYYGPEVYVEETDAYAWMEYPHYYLDYYLYSYVTSFTAAIQISSKIVNKEDRASEQFINFLIAGNSDYPVEVLKKAGVDMTTAEPYEVVVLRMNQLMDEMERVMTEL